jgi:Protein of unknown function (DUF551)
MSDWISVKENLPDIDCLVQVCFLNYQNSPQYAWGARLDDGDGWLWGIASGLGGRIDPCRTALWNNVEADDDYPVQFWRPLDEPPTFQTPQESDR